MEQKLPADWQKVVYEFGGYGRGIVERCFALHSKPPKELTGAEIVALFRKNWGCVNSHFYEELMCFARAIEASVWAKQREPEVVKFRAARDFLTGEIRVVNRLPTDEWEWLDHEGQPQVFDVRVS